MSVQRSIQKTIPAIPADVSSTELVPTLNDRFRRIMQLLGTPAAPAPAIAPKQSVARPTVMRVWDAWPQNTVPAAPGDWLANRTIEPTSYQALYIKGSVGKWSNPGLAAVGFQFWLTPDGGTSWSLICTVNVNEADTSDHVQQLSPIVAIPAGSGLNLRLSDTSPASALAFHWELIGV